MRSSDDVVCTSEDLEQLREQFGAALDTTVKAGEALARVHHHLGHQKVQR